MSSLDEGLPLLAPLLGGVRSGGSKYESSSIASTLSGKSCNNRQHVIERIFLIELYNPT